MASECNYTNEEMNISIARGTLPFHRSFDDFLTEC
jgi:hypothetical protein